MKAVNYALKERVTSHVSVTEVVTEVTEEAVAAALEVPEVAVAVASEEPKTKNAGRKTKEALRTKAETEISRILLPITKNKKRKKEKMIFLPNVKSQQDTKDEFSKRLFHNCRRSTFKPGHYCRAGT